MGECADKWWARMARGEETCQTPLALTLLTTLTQAADCSAIQKKSAEVLRAERREAQGQGPGLGGI
jgi:hypothetical protein